MAIFRKDPCGIMTVGLAYAALGFADYVVIEWLILYSLNGSLWGAVHAVLFNLCIFMCVFSHVRAMITDPGVVPRPANKDRVSLRDKQRPTDVGEAPSSAENVKVKENTENYYDFNGVFLGSHSPRTSQVGTDMKGLTVCPRCDMYRPPRAHHCRVCQGCVRKMDHHCPWINNCVGAYNQKYFLQFLVWVAITSIYAGALTIYSWVGECSGCERTAEFQQSSLMFRVVLIVECCLFGIFVCVMFFDQLSAILKDETGIESLKRTGPYRPNSEPKHLLRETCGTGHWLFWICPCQNLNPPSDPHTVILDPAALQPDFQQSRRRSSMVGNNLV